MQPERIADIEARHANEWLAIEVTRTSRRGDPVAGVLLAHGPDGEVIERAAMDSPARHLMLTFTGKGAPVLLEAW